MQTGCCVGGDGRRLETGDNRIIFCLRRQLVVRYFILLCPFQKGQVIDNTDKFVDTTYHPQLPPPRLTTNKANTHQVNATRAAKPLSAQAKDSSILSRRGESVHSHEPTISLHHSRPHTSTIPSHPSPSCRRAMEVMEASQYVETLLFRGGDIFHRLHKMQHIPRHRLHRMVTTSWK